MVVESFAEAELLHDTYQAIERIVQQHDEWFKGEWKQFNRDRAILYLNQNLFIDLVSVERAQQRTPPTEGLDVRTLRFHRGVSDKHGIRVVERYDPDPDPWRGGMLHLLAMEEVIERAVDEYLASGGKEPYDITLRPDAWKRFEIEDVAGQTVTEEGWFWNGNHVFQSSAQKQLIAVSHPEGVEIEPIATLTTPTLSEWLKEHNGWVRVGDRACYWTSDAVLYLPSWIQRMNVLRTISRQSDWVPQGKMVRETLHLLASNLDPIEMIWEYLEEDESEPWSHDIIETQKI